MPALVVSMRPEIPELMPSVARNWMLARFVVVAGIIPSDTLPEGASEPESPQGEVQQHDKPEHQPVAALLGLVAQPVTGDQGPGPATAQLQQMEALDQARVAILRRTPIAPHSSLAELRTGAMLSGWDLSRWQWLEVDLLPSLPQVMPAGADAYHIGYLAKGSPLS